MTYREMLLACGGTWQGSEDVLDMTPSNIVTDSRQAEQGSLFIALHGERTDGHRYIPDVLRRGAGAVLCEHMDAREGCGIIVEDVPVAMRAIAAANRASIAAPFIGVTGSVGKTTAKEMIASALSSRYTVYKTPGSMNGQIGVPVALMGMSKEIDVAVMEMGISFFGEMTRLTRLIRPNAAVFTNIGDAHLENLHDRNGVLEAKSEILLGMDPDADVFVNGDDPLLREKDFGRRKVMFGTDRSCDYYPENCTLQGEKREYTIRGGDKHITVRVSAYGNYLIYSVLAAVAVASEMGLTDEEICKGIEGYQTLAHRSQVIPMNGVTLIDDCYNANPTSNRAAVGSLCEMKGRRVCILGDMREMGENSSMLHRELGEFLRMKGIDRVLTCGEEAKHITEGAGSIAAHYPDKASLIRAAAEEIQPGDVVLVKASRGAHFEEIVEAIRKVFQE